MWRRDVPAAQRPGKRLGFSPRVQGAYPLAGFFCQHRSRDKAEVGSAFTVGSSEPRLVWTVGSVVGGPRSSEVQDEDPLIDRAGGGCARYRQRPSGHEQRL